MTKFEIFIYESAVKLILEVFGAAGAVWGASEVVTLRNKDTQEEWRYISLAIGILFFIRYIDEQYNKFKEL